MPAGQRASRRGVVVALAAVLRVDVAVLGLRQPEAESFRNYEEGAFDQHAVTVEHYSRATLGEDAAEPLGPPLDALDLIGAGHEASLLEEVDGTDYNDDGEFDLDKILTVAPGEERSDFDMESLLRVAGVELGTYEDDAKKEVAKDVVRMLDAIFDVLDQSGDGHINRDEFFRFFKKSLDAPENQPPKQVVVNRPVADKMFSDTAALGGNVGKDQIDKNEFTSLMLKSDRFRQVVFILLYPVKTNSLTDSRSWHAVDLAQFQAFLARNDVSPSVKLKLEATFKKVAGDDKVLEYHELDSAIKAGKKDSMLLQLGSPSGEDYEDEDGFGLARLLKVDQGDVRSDVEIDKLFQVSDSLKGTINDGFEKAFRMLDAIFDVLDTSGDGSIDRTEFFAIFTRSLDALGNQPPKNLIISKPVADRFFQETAALDGDDGKNQIDKNEFTSMMLKNDKFRLVIFILLHPGKTYNLHDSSTWGPVDLAKFSAFMRQSDVRSDVDERVEGTFLNAAGNDELLAFYELDRFIREAKSG